MSKQKTVDLAETENEATENLVVEQSELDGISSTEETKETQSVVEKVSESETKPSGQKKVASINTVASVTVSGNKKMGVAKFLLYYPQDLYIDALLRFYYPKSFFTVSQWFERIEEILNTPINN